MAIPLTVEMLAHAYDYLCCTPPFNKMNLPHSEDIKFIVSNHKDRFAHYQIMGGEHHIAVSGRHVSRHMALLCALSHEMIHLYMEVNCLDEGNPHGKSFNRLADKVCKAHVEFDRSTF